MLDQLQIYKAYTWLLMMIMVYIIHPSSSMCMMGGNYVLQPRMIFASMLSFLIIFLDKKWLYKFSLIFFFYILSSALFVFLSNFVIIYVFCWSYNRLLNLVSCTEIVSYTETIEPVPIPNRPSQQDSYYLPKVRNQNYSALSKKWRGET